jgi:signal transduction histidine kinase/CheY-like chemotaxis protein
LRFLFFPYIVLLALRTNISTLLKTGFTFSILFLLMAFFYRPPDRQLPDMSAGVLAFFLVTVATAFVTRDLEGERGRMAKTAATFQGLNKEIKQKSVELQSALDSLSKAHLQLQEADRIKNRFLANISHELRTPLTSIRSYSEILLDYDEIDDATRKEFIHTINDESERMALMINENLDLLRIKAGKFETNFTSVNPLLLMDVSIKVVAPMAEKKEIPLIVDVAADFPPVKGDQNQLIQVLVNLLNNAVKFTSTGEITAGVRQKEEMAEFFVADTGEGIFPEEKDVIFTEFYRISESVPDRPLGSGLGLTIAKQIVEHHGGRIWVESTPGKGSTFYFTIPIFAEEAEYVPPEPFHETAEHSWKHEPILVLYESIAIRQSLRKMLEDLGYTTIGADTPKRGMEISSGIRPGLIITDHLEGGENFTELGNWAKDAGIKILMAPLYINPANGYLGLLANGLLSKPFDRFQIVSIIETFVKNKGNLLIISPLQDEARKLQVLLGAEGYTATLYIDESEALKAPHASVADGIIIGSFPKPRRENVITALKRETHYNALPFFLLQSEGSGRFVAAVTLDPASARNSGKGISPLIMAIEKFFVKSG